MDSNLAEIVAKGGEGAGSPAEVAEKCETVVTMLPNNDIVRAVYEVNSTFTPVKLTFYSIPFHPDSILLC